MTALLSARDAGELVIWIAAVVTAVGVIARFRPVRWLARTLSTAGTASVLRAEPVRTEIRTVVEEVLDSRPLTNGEGWEAVSEMRHQLDEMHRLIIESRTDPSPEDPA